MEPDTLTIDCDNEWFRIGEGTLWEGKNLYQLYGEAFNRLLSLLELQRTELQNAVGVQSTLGYLARAREQLARTRELLKAEG